MRRALAALVLLASTGYAGNAPRQTIVHVPMKSPRIVRMELRYTWDLTVNPIPLGAPCLVTDPDNTFIRWTAERIARDNTVEPQSVKTWQHGCVAQITLRKAGLYVVKVYTTLGSTETRFRFGRLP